MLIYALLANYGHMLNDALEPYTYQSKNIASSCSFCTSCCWSHEHIDDIDDIDAKPHTYPPLPG